VDDSRSGHSSRHKWRSISKRFIGLVDVTGLSTASSTRYWERGQGQVRRRTTENFELLLQFAFAFEPDELPRVLAELETFGPR